MNFSAQAQTVFEQHEKQWIKEDHMMREHFTGVKEHVLDIDNLFLAIGKEVATFLASLIIAKNAKNVIEVGTSFGYSTLFLAHAVKETGGRVTTLELDKHKQDYARDALTRAGLAGHVNWENCDAVEWLQKSTGKIDFVLLDAWKDLYVPCLHAIYPNLAEEGIIAADNMIYPDVARPDVRNYREALKQYDDLRSTLLNIGSGIELTTRWSEDNPNL